MAVKHNNPKQLTSFVLTTLQKLCRVFTTRCLMNAVDGGLGSEFGRAKFSPQKLVGGTTGAMPPSKNHVAEPLGWDNVRMRSAGVMPAQYAILGAWRNINILCRVAVFALPAYHYA
jgi:hypothetical protein